MSEAEKQAQDERSWASSGELSQAGSADLTSKAELHSGAVSAALPGGSSEGFIRRLGQHLKTAYLSADPRSLGLFRMALASLLIFDVLRRWPNVEQFYSNTGWLPNHAAIFRPMSGHLFSIYHAFSSPEQVKLLLLLHLGLCLALFVGWRTKLVHLCVLVLTTSLNSRNISLENGGWVMTNLITLWSLFLPLSQRFSVDALKARLKQTSAEPNSAALREVTPCPSVEKTRSVVSLAILAILLQWAIVYYFNAVHKSGPSWRDGTAIYYFIHQDRLTHALGIWLRELLPLSITRGLTYASLVIEYIIPALLVLPVFYRPARMLAWLLGVALHVGIALFASLGPFVWVMLVPYPIFIAREYWDRFETKQRLGRRRVEVQLGSAPGSAGLERLLKALDFYAGLAITQGQELKRPLAARLTQDNNLPEGNDSAKWHTGGSAVKLIAESWYLPSLFRRTLGWLGFFHLLSLCFALFSRFGSGGPLLPPMKPGLLKRRAERLVFWIGQALVALLLFATGSQVLVENRAVPKALKPESRPGWLEALVVYPRLFQGWSMFAPDPPKEDGRVIVDGRTKSGRKLDPLTGREPEFHVPRPAYVWNDGDWAAFHMRVQEPRFAGHYTNFKAMLQRYHEFTTKDPGDALVAYDVWYGAQEIPPPGRPAPPPKYRKLFSQGKIIDSGRPKPGTYPKR